MKKLAIVTISYGHNYGNKLQNYAMQEVYKKFGLEVKTIKFNPTINKKNNYMLLLKNMDIHTIINKIKKKINYKDYKNIFSKRLSNFKEFDKLISYTKDFYEDTYKNMEEQFDYYSVGSDQVWNAYFSDFSSYYLLNFIDSENKIAYAPSFGVDSIPQSLEKEFKESLMKFKALSCREDSGAKILEKLTGKSIPVVVDPTILLNTDEWDKILKNPEKYQNKKYIFLYFLGKISDEKNIKIKEYAFKNECEIVNILDVFSEEYSYGPSEFLSLIKNAYAVFTDSFHATLFSIMYKKAFYVFKRDDKNKSMSSRMDTLLETFELSDRVYYNNFEKLFDVNYENIDKILKIKREEANEYIKKSLQ